MNQRTIAQIKYETKIESDVYEENIYAFFDGNSVSVLVRKNNKFYWKPLEATNIVWYEEYDTIEASIEGIMQVREFKQKGSPSIEEFTDEYEFHKWCVECFNKIKN